MENVKLNVGQISEGETSLARLIYESRGVAAEGKKRTIHGKPALTDIVNWLKSKNFDASLEKELLKILYTYPQGSLGRFPVTLNNHIRAVQEKNRRGVRVSKKEMDSTNINVLKREEAIKHQQTIREHDEVEKAKQEQEKLALEELKQTRAEALKVAREKKVEVLQKPLETLPATPVPTPVPTATPEISREEAAAALERRRMFAERLRQMTENADEEWMKG